MVYFILLFYIKYHQFLPKWNNKKPPCKLIKQTNKQIGIEILYGNICCPFLNVVLNVKIQSLLCVLGNLKTACHLSLNYGHLVGYQLSYIFKYAAFWPCYQILTILSSKNIILTIWRFTPLFSRFLEIKNLHHNHYFSTLKIYFVLHAQYFVNSSWFRTTIHTQSSVRWGVSRSICSKKRHIQENYRKPNKRQCVHDTQTNKSNTFQINHQQQKNNERIVIVVIVVVCLV